MAPYIKSDPPIGLNPTRLFHLVCPRCGGTAEYISAKRVLHVHCGDCLMEGVEIVEMVVAQTRGLEP